MKICRFRRPNETLGWGLLTNSGIQDIATADPSLPNDTVDLIARWTEFGSRVEYLSKRLGVVEDSYRLLAPIARAGKILCIGLNYRDHAVETKAILPTEPIVFSKTSSTLIGDRDEIQLPTVSQCVDFEAELVIVIGKKIKSIEEAAASDAIFGYSVGNDVSARDWQKDKPGKQWFLGKSFDTFAPLGPAIVTSKSLGDANNLQVICRVNKEIMQDGNTREMIFGPEKVVTYISQVMTLHPGDLIYTGTPSGVGMARTPPRFLKHGDVVEIEIERIGKITNRCV